MNNQIHNKIIVLKDASDLTHEVRGLIRNQEISELVIDYSLTSDGDVITDSPLANLSHIQDFKFKIVIGENCRSLEKLFFNCSSLLTAPNLNLSSVENLNWMFEDCKSLVNIPDYQIDAAQSLKGMFKHCSSLVSLPKLKTSKNINEINCLGITQGCSSLTAIPEIKSPIIILENSDDVTDVVRLRTSALDLDEIIINFNVERKLLYGQFTQSNSPFSGLPSLKKIPFKITLGPSCRSLNGLFFGCTNLKEGPELQTEHVTNMDGMFQDCSSLETIPLYNTKAVTSMRNMFHGCTALSSLPLLDTSKVTSVFGMVEGCSNLEKLPEFNLSSVKDLSWFLSGCTKLTKIPKFNTKSAEYVCSMFNHCSNLQEIPQFSLLHIKDLEKIFSGFNNEKAMEKFFGFMGYRKLGYKLKNIFNKSKKKTFALSHK